LPSNRFRRLMARAARATNAAVSPVLTSQCWVDHLSRQRLPDM
jgi:hypothetical protein